MKVVHVLCGHCRCIVATMHGEWDDLFGDEDLRMLCEDCARCDRSPPSRPLLDVVMRGDA